VLGVSNDQGALGFLPLSYYEMNQSKLKLLALVGGPKAPKKNKPVLPTKETVGDGSYFPLSRPIFIYVSEASLQKAEVKEFVAFYLTQAAELVAQVNYIPLPDRAYVRAKENLKEKKLGTAFAGHPDVGLTVDQILKKKATL
jgi:phosphate transport system substrate-binding protein